MAVTPNLYEDGGIGTDSGGSLTSSGSMFTGKEKLGLGISAFSDFLSAGATLSKGKFESSQLRFNARMLDFNLRALERDVSDITYVAGVTASNVMKSAAEMKDRQKVAQAASGFDVNETETFATQINYTDLLALDQINQFAYEASMQLQNKRMEMAEIKANQKIMNAEADYISRTSKTAAGIKLTTGAIKTGALLLL